jgi:hypothetical protein
MLLLTVVAAAPLVPTAAAVVAEAGGTPLTESMLAEFVGAIVLACGISVTITLFITGRLSGNRGLTYKVRDEILAAIEAQRSEFRRWANSHTRGDDDRFDLIREDIYGLALRNAEKDGGRRPTFRALPRRKSFEEEEDERKNPMRHASDVRVAGIGPIVAIRDVPRRPDAILPDDEGEC